MIIIDTVTPTPNEMSSERILDIKALEEFHDRSRIKYPFLEFKQRFEDGYAVLCDTLEGIRSAEYSDLDTARTRFVSLASSCALRYLWSAPISREDLQSFEDAYSVNEMTDRIVETRGQDVRETILDSDVVMMKIQKRYIGLVDALSEELFAKSEKMIGQIVEEICGQGLSDQEYLDHVAVLMRSLVRFNYSSPGDKMISVDQQIWKESGEKDMRFHIQRMTKDRDRFYEEFGANMAGFRKVGGKYESAKKIYGRSWIYTQKMEAKMKEWGLLPESDVIDSEFHPDLSLEEILRIENDELKIDLIRAMLSGIILSRRNITTYLQTGQAPNVGYYIRDAEGFFFK